MKNTTFFNNQSYSFNYSKLVLKETGETGKNIQASSPEMNITTKIFGPMSEKVMKFLKKEGISTLKFLENIQKWNEKPESCKVDSPALLKLFAESNLKGLKKIAAMRSKDPQVLESLSHNHTLNEYLASNMNLPKRILKSYWEEAYSHPCNNSDSAAFEYEKVTGLAKRSDLSPFQKELVLVWLKPKEIAAKSKDPKILGKLFYDVDKMDSVAQQPDKIRIALASNINLPKPFLTKYLNQFNSNKIERNSPEFEYLVNIATGLLKRSDLTNKQKESFVIYANSNDNAKLAKLAKETKSTNILLKLERFSDNELLRMNIASNMNYPKTKVKEWLNILNRKGVAILESDDPGGIEGMVKGINKRTDLTIKEKEVLKPFLNYLNKV